ncbi:MAG: DoxX family protein [Pyrinomonadaceae bacterium]
MTKGKNIASWVIQLAVAGLFFVMSFPKLMSNPETVANFVRWGLPSPMHLVIGGFELLGAIGLLIPRTSAMAALGLILIMIGALFTHIIHAEMMMTLLPLVVILLLGFVIYVRNPFYRLEPIATAE